MVSILQHEQQSTIQLTQAELERLPPHIQRLFPECPEPRYLEPIDYAPEDRKTQKISGVSAYLELLKQPDPEYVPTESWLVKQQREKRLKSERQKVTQQERKEAWDPKKDEKIVGDPFKTLFVGRLAFDVTENDLEEHYIKFGPVKHVRIVRDQKSGKSNGYGFVEFQEEDDFRKAFQMTNGSIIKGRKVVVDVERGRTVSGWLPRRLGGGKGGRHYTKEGERKPLGPPMMPGGVGGRDLFPGVRDRGGPRSRDPRGSRPPEDFRDSFRGGRGGGRGGRDFRDRDPRDREPRDRDRERDPRDRDRERRPQYRDRSPPRRERDRGEFRRGGMDRGGDRGGREPTKYY